MGLPRKELFQFGSFRVDSAERLLTHDGRPIALTPKAFETLVVLVENAGHALDKDELLKKLWPDTFVEEATLAKQISTLRKALGDGENGSRYIETIPKFGYRFMAPVNAAEALDVVAAPPRPSAVRADRGRWVWAGLLIVVLGVVGYLFARSLKPRTATAPRRAVLAVLPFENLSGSTEQEYLGDGLTEELISQLSRMNPERLAVIARTTAMRYKGTRKSAAEIGRELGVNYIVEGSFRREGSRMRIMAQLVQTNDQTYLWAETYERELQQLIPLQREVTYSIARGVAVQVSPPGAASRRAANSQAYDDYLRARFYWNKRTEEGRAKAREYFHSATKLDESFAPAYAGLAETYFFGGGQHAIEDIALPLVNRALELDPTLPEGHVSAGLVALYRLRWAEAERALRQALELDPNSSNTRIWYAVYLRSQGRLEEALAENERAVELDPLSSLAHHEVGVTHYLARRYDRAIGPLRRALEIEPAHHWSRIRLAQAFALQNMTRETEAEIASIEPIYARGNLRIAHLYAILGQPNVARKMLAVGLRDPDRANPLDVAAAYAALGNPDRAFQFLKPARLSYKFDTIFLKVDPRFDSLRADPRFADLLRALGLR